MNSKHWEDDTIEANRHEAPTKCYDLWEGRGRERDKCITGYIFGS